MNKSTLFLSVLLSFSAYAFGDGDRVRCLSFQTQTLLDIKITDHSAGEAYVKSTQYAFSSDGVEYFHPIEDTILIEEEAGLRLLMINEYGKVLESLSISNEVAKSGVGTGKHMSKPDGVDFEARCWMNKRPRYLLQCHGANPNKSFTIAFDHTHAKLEKDNYFFQTYRPCPSGNYTHCSSGVMLTKKLPLLVESFSDKKVEILDTWTYFNLNLTLEFKAPLSRLKREQSVHVVLNADDNDGGAIENRTLTCRRK